MKRTTRRKRAAPVPRPAAGTAAAADIDGEFDFVHWKGKKRKIGNAPFQAEEDAGLDGKNNWLGF